MPVGDLYLSILDLLLVLPLFWAIYRGFMTGFIVEALSLAVFLAGVYAYIRVAEIPGVFSENVKQALEYLPVAVFAIAAIIAFMFSNLAETYTHRSLRELHKGPFDRTFGAVLGVFRYLLLLSCLVIFVIKMDYKHDFLGEKERNKAVLYYRVSQLAPAIFPTLGFRHLENRYIQIVKDGRVNISKENLEKFREAGYEVSEDYYINMENATGRLASANREFEWTYDAGGRKSNRKNVYVELSVTDTKSSLQKTMTFVFEVPRKSGAAGAVIELADYKVNGNSVDDLSKGLITLVEGEF